MESRARQFSSSLRVRRRGHWLTSGAMRLTWLQLRTSSVASRLRISSGIALILLLARSRTFSCFRFRSADGNVEKLLLDKLTSLIWEKINYITNITYEINNDQCFYLKCFNCWKLEGIDCNRLKDRFRFSSLVIFPISSGRAPILFFDNDKFFINLKFPMLEGRLLILFLDKSKFLKFFSTCKKWAIWDVVFLRRVLSLP